MYAHIYMREYSVDFLKFWLAFEVVMLHCNQAPVFVTRPIVDSAVPTFFMISGYFLYDNDVAKYRNKIKKAFVKIVIIFIWSTLLCSINDIYKLLEGHAMNISWESLFDFFLFNENPFAFHLWYISAYLYVLLICRYLGKIALQYAGSLSFVLWFSGVLIAFFFSLIYSKGITNIYIRNFLFQGLPFFLAGHLINKKACYLEKIHVTYVLIVTLCCILLSIYIKLFFDKYNVSTYFFSGVIGCLVFLLFKKLEMGNNIISRIGREDSLYIYIFHPLVMKVYSSGYIITCLGYNQYLYASCVFITTVLGIRAFRVFYTRL